MKEENENALVRAIENNFNIEPKLDISYKNSEYYIKTHTPQKSIDAQEKVNEKLARYLLSCNSKKITKKDIYEAKLAITCLRKDLKIAKGYFKGLKRQELKDAIVRLEFLNKRIEVQNEQNES